MQLDVLYFGQLREAAGKPQELVTIEDGAKLVDLLASLKARFGPAFSRELRPARKPLFLLNGRNVQSLAGLDTPLQNGDTLAILPATFGG
jgi:MoaD family protein